MEIGAAARARMLGRFRLFRLCVGSRRRRCSHPAVLPALERRPDVSAVLDAASRHAADQFPATAPWLLRECYFLCYGAIELYRAMIDAYQTLGRRPLAAVVSRHIGTGHVR